MSYSSELRQLQVLLRRAKKRGFPEWAQAYVEHGIKYAAGKRKLADEKKAGQPADWRQHSYTRALYIVAELCELVSCFLMYVEQPANEARLARFKDLGKH